MSIEITNPRLNQYYTTIFPYLHGWVYGEIFQFLQVMDSLPINKNGGVGEIGIHHGKLFMALLCLASEGSKSLAVDIFDNQHLNVSHSGWGSLEIFNKNMGDARLERDCEIVVGDSADPSLKITSKIEPGSLKLFSVDGAHTAEYVSNDLNIANVLTSNEGIVMVDDIVHYCCLTVLEGTLNWLRTNPTLIPFAMGYNKLFLARPAYYEYYKEEFKNSVINTRGGTSKFFGYDVVNLEFMFPLP